MIGTLTESPCSPLDSSRSVLDFIHHLVSVPAAEQANLDGLLDALADAFGASGAGLATFPEGVAVKGDPYPTQSGSDSALPWSAQPEVIEKLLRSRVALTVPRRAGGSCLLTVVGSPERRSWFLWLEDGERSLWSRSEAALLVLVGQAILHVLMQEQSLAPWAVQLDRIIRRQRLEEAAHIVRRLAHDFGNALTGILGFSELALSQQLSANTPLYGYLTEIHRSAQNAAEYTNQLRQFARRQTTSNRSCQVTEVLALEEKRLQPLLVANVQLQIHLPSGLPAIAMDGEMLRQVLAIVLDNAREAITGSGVIDVAARIVQVNASEARDMFGTVRPGTHLEIRVADSGSGLSPEAQRQLFIEPFFSTKSQKRGFGLATAYGILASHRAGLELSTRPEGGTIVRLILPFAELSLPTGPRAAKDAVSNERILIVDDDPLILQVTRTTLEQAGFRIQTAASAPEALMLYNAAVADPFRLVLSDVLMPEMNGIEFAQRLLARDANVPLLFMSGEIPAELLQECFGSRRFEFLSKPFRPEGLIRAVRTAIDHGYPIPAAASGNLH